MTPANHQTLRPSSPITTLKNSIAAADQKVQDSRNKLRQQRKTHKTGLSTARKDVDGFKSRLSNSGSTDERQRAKALQYESNIRQADDAAAAAAREIQDLGDIPGEEQAEAAEKERCWRKERTEYVSAQDEFQRSKAAADREFSQVQTEVSSALQKRERLQTRLGKLNEEHERLATAKAQGQDAQNRRNYDREMRAVQRAEMEKQYDALTSQFLRRLDDTQAKNAQLFPQIQALENLYAQPQPQPIPPTPELPLSTINSPVSPIRPHTMFANFNFSNSNPSNPNAAAAAAGRRERSSSLLSGVSNFTDDIDDPSDAGHTHPHETLKFPASPPFGVPGHGQAHPAFPHFHPAFAGPAMAAAMAHNGPQRRGSTGARSGSGSTSGSGSANGSQRDPMSPVQQHKAMAGFASGGLGVVKSPGSPLNPR